MKQCDETLETKSDEIFRCVLLQDHEHEHLFLRDRPTGCEWVEPTPTTGSGARGSSR